MKKTLQKTRMKGNLKHGCLHSIIVSLYYVELIRCTRYGTALFCILFVLHLMSVNLLGFLNDVS